VTKMRNVNQENAIEMRTNAIQGASKQGTFAVLTPNVPMAGAMVLGAGNWWKNMEIVMSILIVLRVHSKFSCHTYLFGCNSPKRHLTVFVWLLDTSPKQLH